MAINSVKMGGSHVNVGTWWYGVGVQGSGHHALGLQ